MKLLTKNTDYAIRALLRLARGEDEYISARQISELEKIPYQYLRLIMQELIKNNLIESKEGKAGGFKITKPPDEIFIIDIIRIFQGNLQLSDCMFRKKVCPNRSNCVLRSELLRVEKLVENEFSSISLQSLLDKLSKQL
ncbi:MAG: Rrf2 family transcriptional regulator [Desulfuromonas sp. SDB]|nr:MAG: Rrf2 family transcriptional regulator [Desulfuromonas sp. SDB]